MIKEIIGNYSDSQEFPLGEGLSLLIFKGSLVFLDSAGITKEFFVMNKAQAQKMKEVLEAQL